MHNTGIKVCTAKGIAKSTEFQLWNELDKYLLPTYCIDSYGDWRFKIQIAN